MRKLSGSTHAVPLFISFIQVKRRMQYFETKRVQHLIAEISEGEHIYLNHIDAGVAGIELAYFLCDSGEFISLLGRCNYVTDCRDGSDEIGCEKRKGKQI